MININMTDDFVENDPIVQANPQAYILQLGVAGVPLMQANEVQSVSDVFLDGTPMLLNLRPYETINIQDGTFQIAKDAGKYGGKEAFFLRQLIDLVSREIVTVSHDGTELTIPEILNFTAS